MDPTEPAAWIVAARTVVVFSGAGVSAESGVPTFRGPEGLWRRWRPEELATPEAFARDPRLVWDWYIWRRGLIADCAPNAAHHAIAALQVARPGVHVVTQNVDGLHERALRAAGAEPGPERGVLELHGSIAHDRCHRCPWRSEEPRLGGPRPDEPLPVCPRCGGPARPAVVWFGELLPQETLERAFALAGAADVCVVVGTSGLVEPAASVPRVTAAAGGRVVVVGPERTALDGLADHVLRGPAAGVVPHLLAPALAGRPPRPA